MLIIYLYLIYKTNSLFSSFQLGNLKDTTILTEKINVLHSFNYQKLTITK